MEISKYIGLFLLKNHYCYIHGLGNMELRKRSAILDGAALQAPVYEVVVTPGGSIDDNLANFIATNEQISISKAANALRDYSIETRKEIGAGKESPIPGIGRFIEVDGKVKFVTDENFKFTPAGIPTIKNSKQLEEQNLKPAHKPSYPAPQKPDSINWSMVILVVVLLFIVGGSGYGIYYYMKHNKPVATAPVPAKDTIVQPPIAVPPTVVDTAVKTDTSAAAAIPVDTVALNVYKMVIGDYPNLEKAEKRVRNLKINGNHAEMARRDSNTFLILTTVQCTVNDTTHVKDSLQTLFGYRNVIIYSK